MGGTRPNYSVDAIVTRAELWNNDYNRTGVSDVAGETIFS